MVVLMLMRGLKEVLEDVVVVVDMLLQRLS